MHAIFSPILRRMKDSEDYEFVSITNIDTVHDNERKTGNAHFAGAAHSACMSQPRKFPQSFDRCQDTQAHEFCDLWIISDEEGANLIQVIRASL